MSGFYGGKRVFLTGHTGFKGAWLSLWLRRLGAEVRGYALAPDTEPSLFDLTGLSGHIDSRIGDVRDGGYLAESLAGFSPDIVMHMAAQALVRRSYDDPVGTFDTNVMGTVHLLEACRHAPSVRAVVVVTSDKCYRPLEEEGGRRECDPLGGSDPYSASKGCAELVTDAYHRSYLSPAMASASARSGNVIAGGDWAEDRLVPDCFRAIDAGTPLVLRYPDAIRPWHHILEPLRGYLLLARRLYEEGGAFCGPWNFGPDEDSNWTVRRVAERVFELWGSGTWEPDTGGHPPETGCLRLDNRKAAEMLGWRPVWNVDRALEETVSWHRALSAGQEMRRVTEEQICRYETEIPEGHP